MTLKILVVDDEVALRDILYGYLSSLGHDVVVEADPRKALHTFTLASLDEQPFEVVFTDFRMPVWSGVTFAMHVRNYCTAHELPKVPIVCVTGSRDDVYKMNERDGRPIIYIVDKPCSEDDLAAAIKLVTADA